MRKSRFSDEQIIGIVTEHQAGMPMAEVCRRHGISNTTLRKWRSRFGGMEALDARRLRALENGDAKLKRLPADTMLAAATLREVLGDHF